MRLEMMSFTLCTSSSRRDRPDASCVTSASTLTDVQVSVIMAGRRRNSRSCSAGLSSGAVTGMICAVMRAYSASACARSPQNFLNLASCSSTTLADSGISMPMRSRHLASRISCRISASKLTYRRPSSGWRMMSVACRPALAVSMDDAHAEYHSHSNASSTRATLLYCFTILRASFVCSTVGCCLNTRMGASMRRSRLRAHRMLPATGGMLRGTMGLCLNFSYCACTMSSSCPYPCRMSASLESRSSRMESRCSTSWNLASSASAASMEVMEANDALMYFCRSSSRSPMRTLNST